MLNIWGRFVRKRSEHMPNYAPLKRADCVLVVVDIQEKLLPVINDFISVLERSVKMVKAAQTLDVPVVFTQQYTKGLGATHSTLTDLFPDFSYVEKTTFNCFGSPEFTTRLTELKAETIVIIGIEAHICVCQTALEGLHRGFNVHVVADAVGSRTTVNKNIGLERIKQAGGVITGTELTIYEWIERSDSDAFRSMLPLLK
jgi:nicotinamidase-related amidase